MVVIAGFVVKVFMVFIAVMPKTEIDGVSMVVREVVYREDAVVPLDSAPGTGVLVGGESPKLIGVDPGKRDARATV